MKKTLLLVRHGKACSLDAFERDIDRVLIKRGVSDGYKVAGKLIQEGIVPELILSSPAARASHSAMIFTRAMHISSEIIKVLDILYHGSVHEMIEEIINVPDEINTVAIFSHNPGITDLAANLSSGATSFLPTTGTAIIDFDIISWKDILKSDPLKSRFIIPRELD